MAAIPGTLVAIMALALGDLSPGRPGAGSRPSPTSDGTSIDQGIAYLLMLVALVLTYLIRPSDALFPHQLF